MPSSRVVSGRGFRAVRPTPAGNGAKPPRRHGGIRALQFLVLLIFLAAISALAADVEYLRDVEYGTGGGRPLLLDILRPKITLGDPMPAIIWIHGGAWRFGDKNNPPTRPLAARGYFTASIDYRLSSEATFPAAVEDCKCAVRWLRANAAKYHVDPNRIGVWGGSAGGHLVEFLGTTADDPKFEGTGGWKGTSSRVAAVISYFGPSDFTRGPEKFQGGRGTAVVDFIGGTPEQKSAAYRAASPITHVSKTSAPMLLIHGDHDGTVPVDQSVRMAAALKQAGAEVKLIVVTNGVHGFAINKVLPISPGPAEIQTAVFDWFNKHLGPK